MFWVAVNLLSIDPQRFGVTVNIKIEEKCVREGRQQKKQKKMSEKRVEARIWRKI